jgi:hypothetical protein
MMRSTKTFRLSPAGEVGKRKVAGSHHTPGKVVSQGDNDMPQRWEELKFYTVQEVARFLGYGEDWVRTEFRRDLGTFEDVFQSGGRHRFLRIRGSAISRVVRRLTKAA